jgi:hypothetical protein
MVKNWNSLFLQDCPQSRSTPFPLVSSHSDPRYSTSKGTPLSGKSQGASIADSRKHNLVVFFYGNDIVSSLAIEK